MMPRLLPVLLGALGLAPAAATQGKVDFVKQIAPILQQSCVECHGAEEAEGDVRLDLRVALFHDDEEDWTVVPGKPDESRLFDRLTLPADDPDIMPAEGDPLSGDQIELFRLWIEQGAEWPADGDAYFAAASKPVAAAAIEIPELTEEQQKAEAAAWQALEQRGILVMRIAADTQAVDVNFSLQRDKVDSEDLALLRGLEPTLAWLNLANTAVTDDGLGNLRGMTRLRRLHLSKTGVGDAGLAHLAGLEELEYLNLYGTRVTDAGLAQLTGLPRLKKLFLWQTGVTADGAAALKQKLPGLYIDRGEYVAERLAAATGDAPVNESCPVTGKPVDPKFATEHEGVRIAFCCANCQAKFAADPNAFQAKIDEYRANAKPAGKPVNEICPVSGEAVDPAHVLEHEGRVIGFCCANCKAKFAADPAKFAGKVKSK